MGACATSGLQKPRVLVVGAGIMGAGIAQVAAQAGHPVWLYDMREGAAQSALDKLHASLGALVAKGKMKADDVAALLARITPAASLHDAASSTSVVHAHATPVHSEIRGMR